MGNFQCGMNDRSDEILEFIQNNSIIGEDNTIFDRIIYEYKMLKNINYRKGKNQSTNYKKKNNFTYSNIEDYNVCPVSTIVYYKKRFERLNKWIKMIKIEYSNSDNFNNYNNITKNNQTNMKLQTLNTELKTPKKPLNKENVHMIESPMSNKNSRKIRTDTIISLSTVSVNFTSIANNYTTSNLNKVSDGNIKIDPSGYNTPQSYFSYTENDSMSNISFNPEKLLLNNTDKTIEESLKKYFKKKEKHFKERVSKAPPVSLRWISWLICCGIPMFRDESYFYICLNKNLDEKMNNTIKKDLNRTFPKIDNNLKKVSNEESLYRILKAFASNDAEIEYCQGMNLIVGFLLIVSDFNEVEVFYVLLSLFSETFSQNNYNENSLRGFFCDEFPMLKMYTYMLNEIFLKKLPILYKHLEKLNLPNEVWIAPWLQTLFTICLPINFCVRLWDCIMATGLDFILNFSIALITEFEKDLLSFDESSDVMDYFKSWLRQPLQMNSKLSSKINIEDVIRKAYKLDIPKSSLNKLQREFEQKHGVYFSTLNYCLKKKYDITFNSYKYSTYEKEKETMIEDSHNYKNKFALDTESSNSYYSIDNYNSHFGQFANEKECIEIDKESHMNSDKDANNFDMKSANSVLLLNELHTNLNLNNYHSNANNYHSLTNDIIIEDENSFDDFDENELDEKVGVVNHISNHVLNVNVIKSKLDDENGGEFFRCRTYNISTSNESMNQPSSNININPNKKASLRGIDFMKTASKKLK